MPIQGNSYTVSREGKELFSAIITDYKPAIAKSRAVL